MKPTIHSKRRTKTALFRHPTTSLIWTGFHDDGVEEQLANLHSEYEKPQEHRSDLYKRLEFDRMLDEETMDQSESDQPDMDDQGSTKRSLRRDLFV